MKKTRIFALALALALIFCLLPVSALAADAPQIKSARQVLIGDASSGRIIYALGADDRVEPASITKVMTVLLACEAIERGELSLELMITAPEDCWSDLDEESSNSGIYAGETMSLKDLLYCASLASANEACNIIAQAVAGTRAAFVELMNSRAVELGCQGTHFSNTHGMPSDTHYTTPRDLFIIAREAMSHELFARLCGTASYTTAATNTAAPRELHSSNALLTSDSPYGGSYVYEGANGIKTGHTNAAGYCLLSSVQREDMRLIAVVMGAEGQGGEGQYFDNFEDTISLLNWCFKSCEQKTVVKKGESLGSMPVQNEGKDGSLSLIAAEGFGTVLPKSTEPSSLRREIELYDNAALAENGETVGKLCVYDSDGVLIVTVPLAADGDADYGGAGLSPEQKNAVLIVGGMFLLIILLLAGLRSYYRRRRRHKRRAGGRR